MLPINYSPTTHDIYSNPLDEKDMSQPIFKRSLTGLNSEFSFSWTGCPTKVKEPSLPDYLPVTGDRIVGFIPFPKELALYENTNGLV